LETEIYVNSTQQALPDRTQVLLSCSIELQPNRKSHELLLLFYFCEIITDVLLCNTSLKGSGWAREL